MVLISHRSRVITDKYVCVCYVYVCNSKTNINVICNFRMSNLGMSLDLRDTHSSYLISFDGYKYHKQYQNVFYSDA